MTSTIKFKVTPEEAQPVSDPVSYGTVSGDFLSPHSGTQRNSLSGGKFILQILNLCVNKSRILHFNENSVWRAVVIIEI